MSEPDGAFLRLMIDRDDLVGWLDAEAPSPARWGDWAEIGGVWNMADPPRELSETPAELAETVSEIAAKLAGSTNRAALLRLFRPDNPYDDETVATRHFSYDMATRAFTAGAALFSQNLGDILLFFAVARGAADALRPGDAGTAVVHGYAFEPITQAAMRLGPGGASRFLAEADRAEAAALFQPVAERMLAGWDDPDEPDWGQGDWPEAVDELDALR